MVSKIMIEVSATNSYNPTISHSLLCNICFYCFKGKVKLDVLNWQDWQGSVQHKFDKEWYKEVLTHVWEAFHLKHPEM